VVSATTGTAAPGAAHRGGGDIADENAIAPASNRAVARQAGLRPGERAIHDQRPAPWQSARKASPAARVGEQS